jgi:Protein of unknown function (DUF1552)
MMISKLSLPRRTFLRGVGATLALPFLDAMVPALTAMASTPANPVRRLGVVYVPNGMAMDSWTPAAEGIAFDLPPILQPLEAFRDQMLVLSNLRGAPGGGSHAGAATRFLTGMVARTPRGTGVAANVSMDQLVAKQMAQETQLASLELGLDSRDFAGTCDAGYACAYSNTISWRSATTPLPMENDPRAVFERLFGDAGSTDSTARLATIRRNRSILDSVTSKVASLGRDLGSSDRTKLAEYLEAVRDVERRIQKAEEQSSNELPVVAQPAGVPGTFEEHARLMFDLQVLAYQCDLTRVTTFMIGRELSGRSYPEIGIPEAHHPLSHHEGNPAKIAIMAKLNAYHASQFAYFIEKLRSTPDGDGSLLDHSMILYGAGMSESNEHYPYNLPVLLLGGGAGRLKGGRHIKFPDNTQLASLHVTLLDKMGVRVEQVGNSDGALVLEPASV